MTNVLTKNFFILNLWQSCSADHFLLNFNCIKCSACHLSEHIVNLTPHVTFSDKIGYLACLVCFFGSMMTFEKNFNAHTVFYDIYTWPSVKQLES